MNTKILSNNRVVAGVAIIVATFAIFGGVAYAKSIFDIEFPIAELGNCKDKVACKAYCDIAEHQDACENFAAEYGIAGARESKQAREARKEIVMKDGGPGNCAANTQDPASSCRTYCSARDHMSECVAYGKEHGLMKGKELEEAEKVVKALQGGAELPAGCTDERSCKQTCEEPKNVEVARACFAFAEKAGILPEGIDRARAEKVFKLIEEGKSPFKSPGDFKQCENPANDEIMKKCVAFAADNGLMSPEDAEIMKKTGGKGPGDCRGKEQCDTYCGEHPDECMQFAETHDLIKPEEKALMTEAMARLKESITSAPPEAKQCLVDMLGQDKLDQMLSGQGFVGRDIGEKMRACFEKSFNRQDGYEGGFQGMMRGGEENGAPGMMLFRGSTSTDRGRGMPGQEFQNRERPRIQLPPRVEECVKEKVGEEAFKSIGTALGRPDEKLGQAISECSRSINGPQSESTRGPLGCKSKEECSKFCSDPANRDACKEEFNRGQNAPRETKEGAQGERSFMIPQQFKSEDGEEQSHPSSFMNQGMSNGQYGSPTMMNPLMFQGGPGMMNTVRDGVPPSGAPALFPQGTAYPVAQ